MKYPSSPPPPPPPLMMNNNNFMIVKNSPPPSISIIARKSLNQSQVPIIMGTSMATPSSGKNEEQKMAIINDTTATVAPSSSISGDDSSRVYEFPKHNGGSSPGLPIKSLTLATESSLIESQLQQATKKFFKHRLNDNQTILSSNNHNHISTINTPKSLLSKSCTMTNSSPCLMISSQADSTNYHDETTVTLEKQNNSGPSVVDAARSTSVGSTSSLPQKPFVSILAPVKKGRGRPRKNSQESLLVKPPSSTVTMTTPTIDSSPRDTFSRSVEPETQKCDGKSSENGANQTIPQRSRSRKQVIRLKESPPPSPPRSPPPELKKKRKRMEKPAATKTPVVKKLKVKQEEPTESMVVSNKTEASAKEKGNIKKNKKELSNCDFNNDQQSPQCDIDKLTNDSTPKKPKSSPKVDKSKVNQGAKAKSLEKSNSPKIKKNDSGNSSQKSKKLKSSPSVDEDNFKKPTDNQKKIQPKVNSKKKATETKPTTVVKKKKASKKSNSVPIDQPPSHPLIEAIAKQAASSKQPRTEPNLNLLKARRIVGPVIRVEKKKSDTNEFPLPDDLAKLSQFRHLLVNKPDDLVGQNGQVGNRPLSMTSRLRKAKQNLVDAKTEDRVSDWRCILCQMHTNQLGLGDLYGPYYLEDEVVTDPNDPRGVSPELWFHEDCYIWTLVPSATPFRPLGPASLGMDVITTALRSQCFICKNMGATIRCSDHFCRVSMVHYPCAQRMNYHFDESQFLVLCPEHKPLMQT